MTLYLARYLVSVTAPPLEDGALQVEKGRIAAVGTRRQLQAGWSGEVVDFGDAVILPPLANAHTHLDLTRFPRWAAEADRTSAPADGFVDWILHLIEVKRRQPSAELRRSLEDGLQQSLQAGTGALGDILSCPDIFPAYQNCPLHGRVFLEILGLDPGQVQSRLETLQPILDQRPAGTRLVPGLAPHAPYTMSAAVMEPIRSAARYRPLSIHFAESAEESEFLQSSSGALAEKLYPAVGWNGAVPPAPHRRPTGWLEDQGILDLEPLLVHGVQVTREDAELLGRKGATLVLCPRSNARLRVGRAPVELYLAAGVPLALGTDSCASSPSLSVWDELACAARIYGDLLSPAQLLAMATVNGARALGLQGEMGALEPGWGVHFQVLPLNSTVGPEDLESFLCHRGGDLGGGCLYLDGRRRVLKSNRPDNIISPLAVE
ncbi:MAG: amidohydrolase family protein [Syntrophotaleaceae bacterium]